MEGPAKAPQRSEIAERHRWDLTHLYTDDGAFESAFKAVEGMIERLATSRGTLSKSAQTLCEALQLRDECFTQLEKVVLYAGLSHHENMTLTPGQARWDRAQSLTTKASEASSWFAPEVLSIPSDTLASWLSKPGPLAIYRHAIDDILRQRPHVLSAREEELLAMAGEIASAPETIFSRFTNTNLDYPTIRDESDTEVLLTPARYGAMLYSPNRRVRRDAFVGLHETYAKKKNTLAATLSGQVKQHIFFTRSRKFPTCLARALNGPNIPETVYDNLITTIGRHLPKLHRYVDVRQRLMGLDEVRAYDLYCPIMAAPRETVPYDDAVNTVVTALAPLGPQYVETLRQAVSSRWIDVYETQDKRSGAYSWGSYLSHPYLLMNYNNTPHDRSTLAHELGHAMHSWYTTKHQPIAYADYATFCAEVASTVNEVLLAHYLMDHAESIDARLAILLDQIESIRTTVFRQTLFAEYERAIHIYAEAGNPLTADWLCDTYEKLVRKYYGPKLVLDECASAEALRIPHFYRNFYVYTYATSHCAAVDIGRRIIDKRPGAVEGMIAFLSAGSSKYPLDILRLAGVDLATPEPIDRTMQEFDHLLTEFETLYAKRPPA
jgi:oligoendopeptidase F